MFGFEGLGKMSRVIFRLKRWWPPDKPRSEQFDCYEAIKAGRKTSEFRDATEYWHNRLFARAGVLYPKKVDRAWFMVGFPKGNMPRLEAEVKRVVIHCNHDGYSEQYEIKFENVVEVLE